jgi:F0F1-type ATP synthase membrane subunit b/b'
MSTTAIVLIVVGALVVLAIIAFAATKARGRRLDQRREEAQEVRVEAQAKARRAEQARLSAEEQAERARKEQAAAAELHGKANELDPDVDDADAATARGSEDAATSDADEWVRVKEPRST